MVNPVRNRKIHTRNTRFHIISATEAEALEFIDDDAEESARPHDNTGVDHEDLQEHHLRVALDASYRHDRTKAFIPTPDASRTISNYETLYAKNWKQPNSLIRFSATVEESVGCSYCMDDHDESWLSKFWKSRRPKEGLSELSFEKVMSNFEDTTNERQPYLTTDPSVIAPFEDFESTFEYLSLKALLPYAQPIYQHWRERRLQRLGKTIVPGLKFEENENDDSNEPYICFRRREIRRVRKTRRQDAVSTERIRRFQSEMVQARDLVVMVSAREKCREDALRAEKALFLMRLRVKTVKRELGIAGADEDLFPVKKKKPAPDAQGPSVRPEGLISGPLRMVRLAEHRRTLNRNRQALAERKWSHKLEANLGWADHTHGEFFALYDDAYRCFRNLTFDETPSDSDSDVDSVFSCAGSASSVSSAGSLGSSVSRYRQRSGRGGRVWIDRTMTATDKENLGNQLHFFPSESALEERWKYDPRISKDEKPIYLDEFDIGQVMYRSRLVPPPRRPASIIVAPRRNANSPNPHLTRPTSHGSAHVSINLFTKTQN